MPSFRNMPNWLATVGIAAACLTCCGPALVAAEGTPEAGIEYFEKKVRPLLVEHCGECHTAKGAADAGELVLDSTAGIAKGGSRGPAIVPGKPDESLLLQAVRYADADLQMPPEGKLPAEAASVLARWIELGAPLPAAEANAAPAQAALDIEAGRKFWSFQPLLRGPMPDVSDRNWLRAPIDAFIASRLRGTGLQPSDEADRRTLLRRATFDLTGLPPTADEVERFAGDERPDAYERQIDRLLAAPQHGERYARYWLDLARYADENPSWLSSARLGYRYRDWVVQALNADLPYDRFVRLQLAADLVPDAAAADLAALGFLGLSPTYWKELRLAPPVIEVIVADEWDEKIDAVSRTVLGLTVACARCHDHKFDPITTRDYYALAGVFASTRQIDRPLLAGEAADAVRRAKARIDKLEAESAALNNNEPEKKAELAVEIVEIKRTTPHYDTSWVHAVEDARVEVLPDGADKTQVVYHEGEAADLPIFKRGNPSNRGPVVHRRFLEVLSPAPRNFEHGSGRLELANAFFAEAEALTARVIVNRAWDQHFGAGLVRTTSDFGRQGEPPSHPELLDWLARRLVDRGWSLKTLHRQLVTSATYRQASSPVPGSMFKVQRATTLNLEPGTLNAREADPDNRLLWRMNRRRLDVEAWRDSLLAASGQLDLTMGGPPVDLSSAANHRRTLYARIAREDQDSLLLLYDFPTPTGHSPRREQTTTPLQQLFVLNSPQFAAQAAALAERIGQPQSAGDIEPRIQQLYRQLLARPASDQEIALAGQYLLPVGGANVPATSWSEYIHAVLGLNEVMFVD